MSTTPTRDVVYERVVALASQLIGYFSTLWSILIHPKRTFDEMCENGRSAGFMGPGVFLVANIVVTHYVDHVFGYESPSVPFKLTLIPTFVQEYPFLISRYIIGIITFVSILRLFTKQQPLRQFIHRVAPIMCYASAIYIPYAFLHGANGNHVGRVLIDSAQKIFQNDSHPTFFSFCLKFLCLLLLPQIFCATWWSWIVYLGIRAASLFMRLRSLFVSIVVFMIVEFSTIVAASYIVNRSTIDDLTIVNSHALAGLISQEPPNYLEAMMLAEKVADDKLIPAYGRYAYMLIEISCAVAMPVLHNDKAVVADLINGVMRRDYMSVQEIVSNHMGSLVASIDIKRKMANVVALRNSPEFVDLRDIDLVVFPKIVDDLEDSSPDLIRINDKTYLYACPFVISPALISIFPS